jgi:hypothetical protein
LSVVEEGCASWLRANTTAMPFEERWAEALSHQPNSLAGRCQRRTRPRGTMRDTRRLDHKQEQAQIEQIKPSARSRKPIALSLRSFARDLAVSQPGRVIAAHMQRFPADAVMAIDRVARSTGDAMPDPGDTPKLLGIEMDQLAGRWRS